jgi:hypothetical protein
LCGSVEDLQLGEQETDGNDDPDDGESSQDALQLIAPSGIYGIRLPFLDPRAMGSQAHGLGPVIVSCLRQRIRHEREPATIR